jgi:mRNA interferase YafQ
MNDTLYEVKRTTQFNRDYRLAKKRGQKMDLLQEIILLLADGKTLPEKNRDHPLTGDWKGFRECHITPDWLLVYKQEEDILVLTLTRIGTHSDLDFLILKMCTAVTTYAATAVQGILPTSRQRSKYRFELTALSYLPRIQAKGNCQN